MRRMLIIIFMVVSPVLMAVEKDSVDHKDEKTAKKSDIVLLKRQIKTQYDIYGRPVNQAQNAKGHHMVVGSTKLVSGVDTLTLNTSTTDGKQDISYMADSTYSGRAWSLSASNSNRYWIVPLSGTQFIVKSSSGTDTATVRFILEGE